MKVTNIDDPRIRIELSLAEAEWLKGFIQNFPGELLEETSFDKEIRAELFSALKKALSEDTGE